MRRHGTGSGNIVSKKDGKASISLVEPCLEGFTHAETWSYEPLWEASGRLFRACSKVRSRNKVVRV